MKKLKTNLLLILTLIICQNIYGQQLTLNDIENICNKSNWGSANQFLMNKNWEYFESDKGSSEEYSTITWSYNKSYGDKASAWFYLFSYEGVPVKILYSVFNKPSFTVIQNSISTKGYKLQDSEINDNEIVSTYSNSQFILKITTGKRDKDSYSDESITAYSFQLIKKSSVYDSDNGIKKDYYANGRLNAEYTLANGKMNGSLKVYYEDGRLKKTGNYQNGLANGVVTEYDAEGNKDYEYTMLNDSKNGLAKSYENGQLSYSTYFKNDVQNGERTEFYYNDDGNLNLKLIGEYLDGEKNGLWKLIYIDSGKKDKVLTINNYSNGEKNGFAQEVEGDSLIIANYRKDKLNGNYKVYRDLGKTLFGGVIETDTTKLFLYSKGTFEDGVKSGYWNNYSFGRNLISEGNYLNGDKSGEWKYYYEKYTDDTKPLPYSEKLFLITNYRNGKLNGLSRRYSYLDEEKYLCSDRDKNNTTKDSCTIMVYKKVFQIANYKDDELHGAFELRDSLDLLIAKGNYKDGLKEGEWLERYSDKDFNDKPFFKYYKGSYSYGKMDGKWEMYYQEGKIENTFYFKNDKLDGDFIEWNDYNKVSQIKKFKDGNLKELVVNDSLGINPIRKYELFDESFAKYKCRFTQYLSNEIVSQIYLIKKQGEIRHDLYDLVFRLRLDKNDESLIYKDGEFKLYDLNNNLIITGEYFKAYKMGIWVYYFKNQDVKLEIKYNEDVAAYEKYMTYDNNPFSGDFIYENVEENIKEIRSIKNGLRHGKTEFIDVKTGKTINKEKYKEGIIN